MAWLKKLFGGPQSPKPRAEQKLGSVQPPPTGVGNQQGLRAVPGALTASASGQVIYNMLDPFMQQFMGRCVGVLKKAGIRAKGTGQFSVRLESKAEIVLDEFYQRQSEPGVFEDLVASAKRALSAEGRP